MKTKAQTLRAEAEKLNDEVKKLFDAEDEERGKNPDHVMSAEDRKKVTDMNKKIEELEVKAAEEEGFDLVRAQTEARERKYREAGNTIPQAGTQTKGSAIATIRKTLGELFADSPEWTGYLKQVAPDGRIPENMKGIQSPPVKMGSLLVPRGTKAVVTGASSTSAGALVVNERDPDVARTPFDPITIFDVITRRGTRSDTIEFVRQTSRTNNAAPVAEATAVSGGVGTKPESDFALEIVTTTVKTIAHWIPATKRALADALQIRGIIDDELVEGLRDAIADQILNGSGTGEEFTGIANTTGITAQAYDATGTPLLTTTRKARTKVRTTGKATPTAYVFNPADWETIDLLQDAEDRYFFGGPSILGTPRLWGLPVVEEERKTAGEGLVGDMRQAILWDREDASISVSDSHSDFFIRNLVAILAEQRAAFGVRRPAAIVEIDLTA